MDPEPVVLDDIPLPGRDPDPGAEVEKRIKVGWALVGIFFTFGVFTFLVDRLRLIILPEEPGMLDYARLFAFCVSCLNVLVWMYFPLDDLAILRRWVRTRYRLFPANTAEFYAILLAMLLLLLLIIGALISPFWFGLAGTGVFLWNMVGFSWIRRHVLEAVFEARALYGEEKPPRRQILLKALEQIEIHWSLKTRGGLSDRQQVRHATLALAFAGVTVLAAVGEIGEIVTASALAYLLGGGILIAAEVWIAVWRSGRDSSLLRIREELRSLKAA